MPDPRLKYRLGLFVLFAVVLLAALIVMFGSLGTTRWFQSTNSYLVTFPDAPGVAPGTPVRRSGVRVGEVTGVALDDVTGQVKVTIAIDKRYSIHKNEKPVLSGSLIGGDTVIDFVPRKNDTDTASVPPGTTIAGEAAVNVGTLLTKASEVVPTTEELMKDIRKSLQSLEKMSPNLEATLKEFRELARDTRSLVPEVRQTNAQVQEFVKSVQDIVPDVKKAAEEIRKLATSLGEAAPDFRETSKELRRLLQQANDAFPEVRQTVKELQKFLASLNDLAPEVRKTNKDLQELIKQATDVMPDVKTTVRDIGATAQQYNKLGESLDKLIKDNQPKINRIIDNVEAALERMNDLLSAENRRNIADTLRNVRTATDKLPEMSRTLDDALKEAKETARRLRESMTRADEVLTNIRDVTKPLAERAPSIFRNLDESLDKMNKTLGDVRELMRVVGESDGTFRKLLTDPSLYNRLDEAACMLAKMMPRLDRILKDFETFADKLARHPEAIGLGGVVKPGSGLKDPPAPYPGYTVPPGK